MLPNKEERCRFFADPNHHGVLKVVLSDQLKQFEILSVEPASVIFLVTEPATLAFLKTHKALAEATVSLSGEDFCTLDLVVSRIDESAHRQMGCVVEAVVPGTQNSDCLWKVIYSIHLNQQNKSNAHEYDALSLPKVPARGLYTEDARLERLRFLREDRPDLLKLVEQNSFDANKLMSNIEAFIGSVEIPVGVAGPLLFNGEHVDGLVYAPMATSEGALVASATRGATVISRSGGVSTRVLGQRMMRVPVYTLGNMNDALFFSEWVANHFEEIKYQTRRFSNYADLRAIEPQVFGKSLHIRFIYETGDAAGQNMTTTCTWHACLWILEEVKKFEQLRFENFMIEANLSNDKKVTYQSFLSGRGVNVMAECILPAEQTQRILKVTPKQLVDAYTTFVTGSIAAGMIGININIANVIGAIFTATGQDIACVHESSIGQFHLELTEDGESVYASMVMPSLVIGTVGGGTSLAQQKECLELMHCDGPGKSSRLAEIICGFCLALDLSTLSAIASGQFASAHEKLGRNRPVNTLKEADLDGPFFQRYLRKYFDEAHLKVVEAKPVQHQFKGSSIITELTSHKVNKLLGHFPYDVQIVNGLGQSETIETMVKIKPLDGEVIIMLNSMAAMCDPRLAQEFNRYKDQIGFRGCHSRELAVMSQRDPRFTRNAPKVYGVYEEAEREAYVLIEERLTDMLLMDTADDVSEWGDEYIKAAIDGIAEVHSIWYGKEEILYALPWVSDPPSRESRLEKRRLWEMLGVHAREEFPEWFTDTDLERYRARLSNMDAWWSELENMPKTLIHNDFNPRNIAFRKQKDGLRLCAYDWELATVHLPQYDVAELLAFTLADTVTIEEIDRYVDYHRSRLEHYTRKTIDPDQWRRGYTLVLGDFLISRMVLYTMAHTFRHYKFMERISRTFRRMLDLERERAGRL
jgi:NADP-dependent 3-hydroxy-3-methylglutaryl-CoA reductase